MSQSPEKTVVYAYLRGQLHACHESIRTIWDLAQTGARLPPELNRAIADATLCLPEEMRSGKMPRDEGEFDDVLG